MLKLTLLEIGQIFGSQGSFGKKALSIFEKYGTKAAITDFAILLGGYVSDYSINDSNQLEDRTGWYLTKTDYNNVCVRAVNICGDNDWDYVDNRCGGCRPALPFSSISKVASNKVRGKDGVLRVEYGEYPQYVVDKSEQDILESLYISNSLNPTGKVYTTSSRECEEYEYNGRKFVREVANLYFHGAIFQLSNGESYEDGDVAWVEVTPINWLVDEKANIAVSERILVSGIKFNKESNYSNFNKTNMNNFLNTYLVKDIVPSKISQKNTVNNNEVKNAKVKEIQKILEEIRSNLKYYSGTKDINLEVEKLIEEYNIKLDMYNSNGLSLNTPDYLVIELMTKLTTINEQLKQSSMYKKEYLEILEYIKQILKELNGFDIELEDDLFKDLKLIRDIIIPFLDRDKQKEMKDKIKQIILSNKKLVEGYIQQIDDLNYKIDKPRYKNKKGFEISLRKELHPILEELNLKVRSKDIIETTKKYMSEIMISRYEIHKNGIIELYFNTINEMMKTIEGKLNYLDIRERKIYNDSIIEVIKIDNLNEVDLKQIINIMNNIIKNIYIIQLDIDDRIKQIQSLSSYRIKL